MADIPEHFYETARSIRNGVIWESNAATRVLAEALYGAWKEGAAEEEAKNERLRKALEPFAREAAEWWWKFGDDQQVSCRPGPPHDENEVAQFTVGDLRAARRALEGGE